MHLYQSRFLRRGEVWFDHEPDNAPVDWIFYHQRSRPVPGARWKYFHTIVLDLSQPPEALLGRMSKTTAYHIRRARDKDRVRCESMNPVDPEVLDDFAEMYKRFAAAKGLPSLDRPFLDRLALDRCLEVSVARDTGGQPLAYHVYYLDANRSCLLHTISLHLTLADSAARNTLGRANRYLFWTDILRHQEHGLKIFDFGGWYPGNTDAGLLQINRFKENFGGTVRREYDCEQIRSLKAWVVLRVAATLRSGKQFLARLRPRPQPRQPDPADEAGEPGSAPKPAADLPALHQSEALR